MVVDEHEYSPFDAPVKEPVTLKKQETSGGVKMEQITEAELGGGNSNTAKIDEPLDAPTFEIPTFDEIPQNGSGDPFAPGSSNSQSSSSGGGGGKGGGGNTSSEGTKVDNGFAKEFSEYSAKWLVDIFFRLLIAGFVQYAKIDKIEVIKAVNEGQIDGSFLKFIDEANDNVTKTINVTDDEKKFVIEPLKYFLEVKKVQLKPEWMFITGLLMVGGGLFIKAQDVKNENKALLDKIIRESQKIREENAANANSRRRQEPYFHENVESFNRPVDFSTPPKNEGGIEVVHAEAVDNDNNAS